MIPPFLLVAFAGPLDRAALGPPPPPQTGSCRVGQRDASWSEQRLVPPYTGTAPLTSVRFEACAFAEFKHLFENMGTFMPGSADISGQAIHFEAALDPSYGVPVIDMTVAVADITVAGGPFDGIEDFAGTSGIATSQEGALFQEQTFAVTFPGFFQQPGGWILNVRATVVDANYAAHFHGGAFHYIHDPEGAVGVVTVYNP